MGVSSPAGVCVMVLVIVVLVNVVTSVPTIFLVALPLSSILAEEGVLSQEKSLVLVPYFICLAANAYVNGSCTNVICMERFRDGGLDLSVWHHARAGLVVSAVTLTATAPILLAMLMST
eukprot:scaffold380865_cov48-Prasinocladus_malaysianus.AAC.1